MLVKSTPRVFGAYNFSLFNLNDFLLSFFLSLPWNRSIYCLLLFLLFFILFIHLNSFRPLLFKIVYLSWSAHRIHPLPLIFLFSIRKSMLSTPTIYLVLFSSIFKRGEWYPLTCQCWIGIMVWMFKCWKVGGGESEREKKLVAQQRILQSDFIIESTEGSAFCPNAWFYYIARI